MSPSCLSSQEGDRNLSVLGLSVESLLFWLWHSVLTAAVTIAKWVRPFITVRGFNLSPLSF